MTLTLRYPLQLDGTGRPLSATDPGQIWTDRAQVLLSTMTGERPADLFYGCDIAQATFSPVDLIESEVMSAVQGAFARYLVGVDIEDISVDLGSAASGTVNVTILFTIPEGTTVEVSSVVDLAIIGLG